MVISHYNANWNDLSTGGYNLYPPIHSDPELFITVKKSYYQVNCSIQVSDTLSVIIQAFFLSKIKKNHIWNSWILYVRICKVVEGIEGQLIQTLKHGFLVKSIDLEIASLLLQCLKLLYLFCKIWVSMIEKNISVLQLSMKNSYTLTFWFRNH